MRYLREQAAAVKGTVATGFRKDSDLGVCRLREVDMQLNTAYNHIVRSQFLVLMSVQRSRSSRTVHRRISARQQRGLSGLS